MRKNQMSNSTQLRRLRAAVVAAAATHEKLRQATFKQRSVVGIAERDDILARGSGGVPRPVGGANRPLEPTQIALQKERDKLHTLEMQRSEAERVLHDFQGEVLATEEAILSARREQLALRIIAHTATTAEVDELIALVPDMHHVRLDQQFSVSPLVSHAKELVSGAHDAIHTPTCDLNGSSPAIFDWQETRNRILAEQAA